MMVAAAFKGVTNKYSNETATLVSEYNMRQRLAKLGFRFDPKELSAFKAHAFMTIAEEISRLEHESIKSSKAQNGK
jgi:hypothetical protein